ncbi:putative ATP-binding cassette transporter [Eremomyces bilateralis CBS 781.70]|uniref:ATP-binding cassette transporter n=1 Tax=Eremomyces bilateralis CBS 781.70 TaxID=1392243 RepID=A0A6G1GG59_9PEZI|nr:putative ATP-binding cassette transporter [Eremomyces bilateralis CBS 781.70]KAF1817058.1 putative ATP-binding cassette transporter [Eremomyces bilateralis CBS 781.70]
MSSKPAMVVSDIDSDGTQRDLELGHAKGVHLVNDVVRSFAWNSLDVQIKDRKTKDPLSILSDASGIVHQGEMLAIMGPSGSGKTTLLNALAHRKAAAGATTTGEILANGQRIDQDILRQHSSYVEQEDALIGSLTVIETMNFAAGLALSSSTTKKERKQRVRDLIASFGLQGQADTIVGTPIQKGLSGGQKKRLGVASQLVTDPRILFLDEPTSGLDSALSYEVMNYIKEIGRKNKLIIIASIHQPSTSTFKLFDRLCLLSTGKTCYFGSLPEAHPYFSSIDFQMPTEINPAEYYLDLINTDLAQPGDEVYQRAQCIAREWNESDRGVALKNEIQATIDLAKSEKSIPILADIRLHEPSLWTITPVLLHRSWTKAYRDFVVYGIRIAMYLGLAILMGTVFLRLSNTQANIQPFINAIFFGGAFMSFMAIAYVPAFLEDLATFKKERANGLVGPLAFNMANFIIGLPFIFLIAALFSIVEYFLTGFRQEAQAFFMSTLWLFLDLLAAEALVVLVSSIFPIFVLALAVTAFANGLWMCVDGFLVPMNILNPFWKYVFHYIDYQAYVFQGMMVNEFKDRDYRCTSIDADTYHCMYPSDLNSKGKIRGTSVLEAFGISVGKEAQWVGISIAIIAGYRILAYMVLRLRK